MKSVSIYARKEVLWVVTKSLTEDHLWIADGPVAVLFANADAAEKGEAVLHALSRSRQVQRAASWDAPSVILCASGARSWRVFEKGSKLLWVKLANEITITPTQQRNNGDGYLPLAEEKEIHLAAQATPVELGNAVDQALTLCQ